MIDPRCVVFDFAFTLSSDLFFKIAPPDYPSLQELCEKVIFSDQPLVNQWMLGNVSSLDIAETLSRHCPLDPKTILHYLELGCEQTQFNPAVMYFALAQKACGRKTALVTMNMDVFTNVIVPVHHLDDIFDVIVNSSDCRELRKDHLWPLAFERLGHGYGYTDCLLIDDGASNVARFQALGGQAYQYTGDADFLAWLKESGLEDL